MSSRGGRLMGKVYDGGRDHWDKMQADAASRRDPHEGQPALKGGGGGGTSNDMIPIKDYVDSRDDAVESRLTQQLDKLSTKGTIWAAMATAVGLIAAMLTFGGDRFDSGLAVSPAFQEAATKQATIDGRQNATLNELNGKLDILIVRTAPDKANDTSHRLRGAAAKPD